MEELADWVTHTLRRIARLGLHDHHSELLEDGFIGDFVLVSAHFEGWCLAERPLPKLPLPLRPDTRTTPQFTYSSGQVFTELNPAPSPSGHPLLSGPPT